MDNTKEWDLVYHAKAYNHISFTINKRVIQRASADDFWIPYRC